MLRTLALISLLLVAACSSEQKARPAAMVEPSSDALAELGPTQQRELDRALTSVVAFSFPESHWGGSGIYLGGNRFLTARHVLERGWNGATGGKLLVRWRGDSSPHEQRKVVVGRSLVRGRDQVFDDLLYDPVLFQFDWEIFEIEESLNPEPFAVSLATVTLPSPPVVLASYWQDELVPAGRILQIKAGTVVSADRGIYEFTTTTPTPYAGASGGAVFYWYEASGSYQLLGVYGGTKTGREGERHVAIPPPLPVTMSRL